MKYLPTACFLSVKNAITAATVWMKTDDTIAQKKTLYHMSKKVQNIKTTLRNYFKYLLLSNLRKLSVVIYLAQSQ